MPHGQKIATCCYCGTRAALVLRGKERHELACSNCGAPLHDLKMLRSDAQGDRELVDPMPEREGVGIPRPSRAKKKGKYRKKKSLSGRFMEKLWDNVEDVFEDVFDEIFD